MPSRRVMRDLSRFPNQIDVPGPTAFPSGVPLEFEVDRDRQTGEVLDEFNRMIRWQCNLDAEGRGIQTLQFACCAIW